MSLSPFPISSLTTAGKQGAAAGLLAQHPGPYTMRLGLAKGPDGVTGEPTPGVSGYARPTVTLTHSNGELIVGAAAFGAFGADLGPARALSIHAASGTAIICEWLEQQRVMGNGASFAYTAGQIRVAF